MKKNPKESNMFHSILKGILIFSHHLPKTLPLAYMNTPNTLFDSSVQPVNKKINYELNYIAK